MIRRSPLLASLLCVALMLFGVGSLSPPRVAAADCVAFPETGKSVCGRFLAYWEANGGLLRQGLPLTDEFSETNPATGKTYRVQYFERARFELHPENAPPQDVQLGLLGLEQFAVHYPGVLPAVEGDPFAGDVGGRECARFHFTGETVCGPFLSYWREHGELAQHGYPISPVFLETNPSNGRQYPTQYFERARFEFHVGFANTPNAVQLGLLGREQLLARYPNGIPGESPVPPTLPSHPPKASPLPSPGLPPP
ncbi:MAG: hypothetical protein U0232_25105 [Thermomicrobiales bacterium]